jgi:hypothetical protein
MVGVHQLTRRGIARYTAYTHEAFRECLVKWIVVKGQPFSEIDAPPFCEMVGLLNSDANVPSNDTVKHDIGRCFGEGKERMRATLQGAPDCLSFVIDAWTSPSMLAFLGTTVHWIDADWRLRNLLLAMPSLSGRHTGENLCTTFKAVCHDFGVTTRLLAITTDSASSSDTLLAHLEAACLQQGVSFNRDSMHVRCIAHIINLALQDFLRTLNANAMDCEDAYNEQRDPDPSAAGFIQRLRKLVVKVRDSPQRHERFARQCMGASALH